MPITPQGYSSLKESLELEIESLRQVAALFDLEEADGSLKKIAEPLRSDRLRLVVSGRFKCGKSTLVNALLGRPTKTVPGVKPGQGVMPVNYIPCTAILTLVTYAETPYVRVWRTNGRSDDWSFERYLSEATVKDDDEATRQFFYPIRMFEVGYPTELGLNGVDVIDSPGMFDADRSHAIADIASTPVVMFRSDNLGQAQLQFMQDAVGDAGSGVFCVVNLWDGQQPDEALKAYMWKLLVTKGQGGPPYSGQELSSRNIFLVDARRAEKDSLAGIKSPTSSGLGELERALSDYLTKQYRTTCARKYVSSAVKQGLLIEGVIRRNRSLLEGEVTSASGQRHQAAVQRMNELAVSEQLLLGALHRIKVLAED